jgi:hypothetical protein
VVIAFDPVGEYAGFHGSEPVSVADTTKARIHHIIQHRSEAVTETKANARFEVGFKLSAS